MKLTLSEPRFFKEPIIIISELVNEVVFKINRDGLELVAMDPANVAMVVYKLLGSAFVEYEIDDEIEIAVNLDNLKQVLRRAKPADIITLELLESKLKITLKGTSERVFTLSLINLNDDERQKVPNLDFKSRIEIPSNLFNEAIEDMDVVSDSVAFEVKDRIFSVQAAGNLSTARVSFKENDNLSIESNDNVRSRYSLEYLKKIIKGSKLSDVCRIWLGNEYPLKIEYKVMDRLSLQIILAPRVSND
ncbi:proliferating cell nuclear antigen (pcna) [Candidatus Woesearchaeota archaeon]|nr:proliferating cell nuclear antigen (pcna) [Candidatus Woesearchaeota archaeon]